MSKHVTTTIRYDGPALVGHDMDVQDLAPALLALAEIAQIANRKFNGERASLRVLVNADVEQQCFMLDLSLVQSIADQAAALFTKENIKTAREIAADIGLVMGVVGVPATLFGVYKWLFGRETPPDQISFTKTEATGTTVINVYGDGNSIEVSNDVAALASDPEVAKRVQTVLRPLGKPEYRDFTVLNRNEPVIHIDRDEARGILAAAPPILIPPDEQSQAEPIYATGPAWVDTSHFRGVAKWKLVWAGQTVDAKMPEEFLKQFQENDVVVVPNAKLTVRMKVLTPVDENGQPSGGSEFVVEEVLNIDLPPKAAKQGGLFDDNAS